MSPSKSLNPGAPTISIPGNGWGGAPGSPSVTATTASSASTSEFDVSHLSFKGDEDSEPRIPGPPTNTPVNEANSPVPKVAGSLGHGWKSTFPLSIFPSSTSHTAGPNSKLMTKLKTSTGPNGTTHPGQGASATTSLRTRATQDSRTGHAPNSPSVSEVLPSDHARREAKRNSSMSSSTDRKAKLALQHLYDATPASDDKHGDRSSDKYVTPDDHSGEEDQEPPIIVDWRQPQHQQSPLSSRAPPGFHSTRSSIFAAEPTSPVSPVSPIGSRNISTSSFAQLYPRDESISDLNNFSQDIGEGRNVYLPDLPSTATEDILRKIGQSFGRVVSVKVENSGNVTPEALDMLPDGAGRGARIYAFVMFDAPGPARDFMKYMKHNNISVQYGKETPHLKQKALEDPHSSNLYVAEIPLDATEQEMRDLFYPATIASLRFLTDDQGNRRGTAMVRLMSRAQAEDAIRRLDLKYVMRGCTKTMQVRIADSENQKLLKKQTPRPTDLFSTPRRPSVVPSPVLPSPPGSVRGSPFPEDIDDTTLIEHMKACEEELRRRQCNEVLRRRPSSLGRSTSDIFRNLSITREPLGPGTPPGFDLGRRRLSDDVHPPTPAASRRPSVDASLGRGYETPSLMTRISRKPALEVTIGRSDVSLFGAQGLSRWGSNDSQEQLLGSGSESISSSVNSLASFKEVPRSRHVAEVFRDSRVPF